MIYKNVRPFAIEIVNTVLNERYVIQPQGLTPEMPKGLDRGAYEGTLIPMIVESKIVRAKNDFDGELFQEGFSNDGLYESQEESDGSLLNEVKRGRGRPKKI